MNRLIVILAFALLLKPIFPVVEYIVNYEYISKVLCVNKAKPQMKCNGKCHLMKELAKASESEKPISSDKKENSKQEVEILFFHDIKQIEISPIYCINKNFVGDSYSNLYFHTVCYSVFHPPTFIF